MNESAGGGDAGRYPSPLIAWIGVTFLLLCYFMFFVDRNILTLLVAPVRRDLQISDAEMGILNGYAFSVLGGVFSIPFAWWADRRSRRGTIIFGVALWGCCTIASGFTVTFAQLLLTRMGLGIAEASLTPAAFSMISDYFPRERRGFAVGVYGAGGFGGIGLSYLIGGAVLAAFRGVPTVDLPVVGATSLWHAAFIVVGAITVLLAIAMFTVSEPARMDSRSQTVADDIPYFQHLRKIWPAFWRVAAGYMSLGVLSIGWFAWLPTYFIRVFKLPPISAAIEVGWVTTIGGVGGVVVGGFIADWLMKRGARGGKLPTLIMMFAMGIPCALGILVSDNPNLSLFWAGFFTFMVGIGFQQYGNVMQEMFPAHLKARAVASWNFCNAILTYGVGPFTFGLATDYVFRSEDGLRYTIGLCSLPVIAVGFACAWYARKPYDRARHMVDPTVKVALDWLAAAGGAHTPAE
jgi:MFS family permease